MTYDTIAPYTICAGSYICGSAVMYLIMKPKVEKALLLYDGMRQAFQDKHVTNQALWQANQKIWKIFQELLTRSAQK